MFESPHASEFSTYSIKPIWEKSQVYIFLNDFPTQQG